MQLCEILIGDIDAPSFYFTSSTTPSEARSQSQLMSTGGVNSVDPIGDELSIDLLEPVVHYCWFAQRALKPTDYDALKTSDGLVLCGYWNDSPSDIPYSTPVWYRVDGVLQRKAYFSYATRAGRDTWEIHAVSAVGLLESMPHRGGVYTGKTVAEVLTEFFGGDVGESENGFTPIDGGLVRCLVEDAVATNTVHGYLPNVKAARNNLHKLLMAYIINLTTNADGDLVFAYLRPVSDPPEIEEGRIYIGGDVEYSQTVTDVELTEYTYVFEETVEAEKVYDNTTAPHTEGEALVTFKTPINPATLYTSEDGSLVVRDANETSAYVSGHGIIYAKPYQIQERVLIRSSDRPGVRNTKSVSGVTLVNPLNSSNLMDKLFEFYTQRRVVSAALELQGEKPGETYRFISPYGEETKGFIQSMSWAASGITRADCEIVTNYEPTGVSTNMQNMVLLTGSGTWEVPSAVRQSDNPYIRAVLIQGGQGGYGGNPGASSERNNERPGAGGSGGTGGSGGKVLTVDIDVTDIESFNYSCGTGGSGGTSGQAGAAGGETTFGDYSSYNGAVAPGGILNLIDGKFYARSGSSGIAGAAGGNGGDADTPKGSSGGDLTVDGKTYRGGTGGSHQSAAAGGYVANAYGGGGGGAANGGRGGNGGNGSAQWQAVAGGSGGTGATATVPGTDAQFVGCGGNGGNGGGGGGAPGVGVWSYGSDLYGYIGSGGAGSVGGKGAPGGILIYY